MAEKLNSALISFDIIKPSADLDPFVSHYWILKAGAEMKAGERVIPSGAVSLVFHRADSMMPLGKGVAQPKAFISGISTGYADLRASGAVDMLVVVFRPWGAGIFLTAPASDFRNSEISVEDAGDPGLTGFGLQDLPGTFRY